MSTQPTGLLLATVLAVVASPALASSSNESMPVQPTPPTNVLQVPGMVTPAGKAFAKQCDDKAFAVVDDAQRLANRCQKLLNNWRLEAFLRGDPGEGGPNTPKTFGTNFHNHYGARDVSGRWAR